MKAVLIFDNAGEFEQDITIEEFESKEQMIDFINEKNIGKGIIAAYEYCKEIEIEPFEKVVNYRIK